ncbi:MAG: glycine cleavage system protein H [Deltaproteobacteria bacterium RIFCSPLOWO2_12_FULL_40_28]|nr:MAG: glycine cleavage system protein H [Deltaproteobacteria bacterium RIFCSPHIGHO2_02_FULL_40_28]OGQ20025.1 MAG: glycine cleavage system protein H [Deltaproteobacteria bacterium RIFCSPHIGHO2_12_FULL_40_32]OGQ40592.1 MAG: glycine cleavage system protein H [Deltaproteobacteria bacterium RIFCSPLOWO2_02_FULL_40_36]OGQ54261.1 MAG: glycine cleavage system protein H [Deltaproteobacteria bacterium RIFCSPLOWO2_12_FULL_40_28]
MTIPQDLKYSKEHEWVRVEGQIATIGVTDFAQEQLGDIVMVELPSEGTILTKDESFGVVESVKSVSDVFAPVSGKIVEANDPLTDSPGIMNEDCYGEGWIVKVEMSDPKELDSLMDAKAYQACLAEGH